MSSPRLDSNTDLTTDRLVLRPWTTAQATAAVAGTRQTQWASDFPADGDLVVAALLVKNPAWLNEYGHRQIVERRSGLVVGSLGLFWPPEDGAIEIGYGVVVSRRGCGYASEAARALTEFAFTAVGVRAVHADVELANPASVRVLEKAGFSLWNTDAEKGTARYRVVSAK